MLRTILCAAAMWIAVVLGSSAALTAPPAELDARIEGLVRTFDVPGMAVTIVEDGDIELARGYGVRKLGAPERVDANTIFPIASTGKAFTVAALALLVDQNRFGWDDKVIDHLPGFQMYDPWVTREITIRDMLVHNSGLGLGAGDLLFVPRSSLSRAETVERLRYIEPETSFRSGYAYDNVLYIAVGQLIEEVTGQTWEAFLRDHILKAAGMESSTTDDADRFRTPNRAYPHARLNGAFRGLGDQELLDETQVLGANSAPAGGVAASAADLGRWLSIQLARGKLPDGGRLYSEAAAKEMWTPQTLIPIDEYPAPVAAATPQFMSYALGWEVRDYKGHKIIWHDGADIGFGAIVMLIPEKRTGFSIMVNAEDGVPVIGLMFELLDHYLGKPKVDWPADWAEYKAERVAEALKTLEVDTAEQADVGPSLQLAGYAGDYADPWYGPISIDARKGELVLDFKQTPGMTGELEHWQYDTFRTRWDDRTIEPAYMTFGLTAEGTIDEITMKPVSPVADFSYDYEDLRFEPIDPPE